ncbi:hypothetical protein ACIBD9_11560 [Micromonospora sp. NPDC050784]|uniref:hypothetical protein n=1 Tax=Micromonospora sp. NPDC050784 TaxID=3364281 RepID=UPI0037BB0A38
MVHLGVIAPVDGVVDLLSAEAGVTVLPAARSATSSGGRTRCPGWSAYSPVWPLATERAVTRAARLSNW